MVTSNQINELGRKIGREFPAEKVVLFGSYAQGNASPDSDIDLLVIAETSLSPTQRYSAVRGQPSPVLRTEQTLPPEEGQ